MEALNPQQIDALVLRVQAGDHAAFHVLVLQVQRDLRLVVAGFMLPVEELEGIVQDSLVTAYEKIAQYRAEGTFQPWLHAIARNKARTCWNQRRRMAELSEDRLDTLVASGAATMIDDTSRPADEHRRLVECMQRVGERMRMLLTRRYVDQVPLATLAQQFKQSETALASLLQRLRAKLRACVEMGGRHAG